MKRVLFVLVVLGLALGPSVVPARATQDGMPEAGSADTGRGPLQSFLPGLSNAERENLAAAEAWDAAFNSKDLEAVMALYADGVVSMPFDLPVREGKATLQQDFEGIFRDFDVVHHQTRVKQLEVQGSMAVERGEYTLTLTAVVEGKIVFFEENGKHVMIRKRINGSWLVVMEIWNRDESPS